jgi:hypothetical protein
MMYHERVSQEEKLLCRSFDPLIGSTLLAGKGKWGRGDAETKHQIGVHTTLIADTTCGAFLSTGVKLYGCGKQIGRS